MKKFRVGYQINKIIEPHKVDALSKSSNCPIMEAQPEGIPKRVNQNNK